MTSEQGLENKTVLVTGATGNLGSAISQKFARAGFKILACYRTESKFQEAFREIVGLEDNLCPILLDFKKPESIHSLISKFKAGIFEVPGLMVNTAAVDSQEPIDKITTDLLNNVFTVNVTGPILLIAGLAALWKELAIKGQIINISSLLAIKAANNSSAYAGSKAAMEAFARNLAYEYGPSGIRCNNIRLAAMPAGLTPWNAPENGIGKQNEKLKHNSLESIPSRRFVTYEEIAAFIYHISSRDADFLNGQDINFDGGLSTAYPGYFLK